MPVSYTHLDVYKRQALNGLAFALLDSGAQVRVLRDPTRGGVATTLCEFAEDVYKRQSQYGDNAYFYDSAEGLLTAVVLLLAEFVPPKDGEPEKRHIVSAFKLVQDLLAMPSSRGRNGFQLLVDILPPEDVYKRQALAQPTDERNGE